jgi:D-cysteine desulfhydrase family pyridoxal phosphate-dependent enzyme
MPLREPHRYTLAHLPTPLEPLPRLSEALKAGTEIWVKRDDCTGLALGGNKVRKLEVIVAGARARGADTLVTVGAAQSNHVRLTAAGAARAGLHCTAVLFPGTGVSGGEARGNVLLDHLLGAEIRETPFEMASSSPARLEAFLEEVLADLRRRGRVPEYVPAGGASAEGALGYALAIPEILAQARTAGVEFAALATAVGTGGTLAGLLVGAAAETWPAEQIGYRVLPEAVARSAGWPSPEEVATETATLAGLSLEGRLPPWRVSDRAVGPGYGQLDGATVEAITLAARTEGLVLDPVYSGKAMAGLLADLREGRYRGHAVLFLHTGGAPALFAHPEILDYL